jgi:hypothetical protein
MPAGRVTPQRPENCNVHTDRIPLGAVFRARAGARIRVRWALEEAGIPYRKRLTDAKIRLPDPASDNVASRARPAMAKGFGTAAQRSADAYFSVLS